VAIGFVLLELVRRFPTTTSLDSHRPIFIFDVKEGKYPQNMKSCDGKHRVGNRVRPPHKRYFVGKETETSPDYKVTVGGWKWARSDSFGQFEGDEENSCGGCDDALLLLLLLLLRFSLIFFTKVFTEPPHRAPFCFSEIF